MVTRKILILSANPKTTSPLRLDEQIREIDQGLYRARHRIENALMFQWNIMVIIIGMEEVYLLTLVNYQQLSTAYLQLELMKVVVTLRRLT